MGTGHAKNMVLVKVKLTFISDYVIPERCGVFDLSRRHQVASGILAASFMCGRAFVLACNRGFTRSSHATPCPVIDLSQPFRPNNSNTPERSERDEMLISLGMCRQNALLLTVPTLECQRKVDAIARRLT
jgi:hypothetical protein